MSRSEQSASGQDAEVVRPPSDIDEVSLGTHGDVTGMLSVSLHWDSGAKQTRRRLDRLAARARSSNTGVDLDLGCLYEFTDGQRGVVQAVGNRNGDYTRAPYIRLDRGIDHAGQQVREELSINMDRGAHFRRILLFAMVSSGTDDLSRVGAVVTIRPASGPSLELRLEAADLAIARSCAVAQILCVGSHFALPTPSL